MAEGAPFERIVLINSVNSSDFQYEFLRRVGRYTHIQSINGILLDGLSIEKVTDVFRKLPEFHVQLMVRYVHMAVPQDSKPREEEGDETAIRAGGIEHPLQLPYRQSLTTMNMAPEQMRQKPPSPIPKPGGSLSLCSCSATIISYARSSSTSSRMTVQPHPPQILLLTLS